MNFKCFNNPVNNNRGGGLLITVVTISLVIFIFMAGAAVKLVELSRESANVNERLRYINIIEDLSQAVARAYVLGRGACPAGNSPQDINGHTFCFPNTGVTGVAGLNGICVDIDKDASTTNDNYCIQSINLVTQLDFEEESKRMYAEERTLINKFKKFAVSFFEISSAYATCNWWGVCTPGGLPLSYIDPNDLADKRVLDIPAINFVPPATAATELTPSATALARNNREPWSPNLTAWTPATQNEIFTPNCNDESQDWLGCFRCQANDNIKCISFTLCPPNFASCTGENRYRQFIAVFLRDHNI